MNLTIPQTDELQSPGISGRLQRVFVAGASGYMGQQLVRELVAQKYEVVCLVRPGVVAELNGAEVRIGDVCDPGSLQKEGFRGQQFDAVFSCLSTRSGGIKDAWAVDHQANLHLLEAARRAEVTHFVLLSAICVQKPLLAFQHAKLTFEKALMESGLTWSIVRPTAFFKSLAGQVEAVRSGKPFKVFGDGRLTACKPIAEADLARFMASCLTDRGKRNAILPIGGPGDAITPREQGELLFALCKRPVRFQHIPVGLFDGVIAVLDLLSIVIPTLRDKAEFARIGRYYATESMLWLDPVKGSYDADATPAFGTITLRDFYERVLQEGLAGQELRGHALFHPRNQ